MLSLDEAIKHCEEVVQEKLYDYQECVAVHDMEDAIDCRECGEEHRQLAEWLRKYQKIENIVDDCDLEAWEVLEMIKEVMRK
jgi:hypothetical protein